MKYLLAAIVLMVLTGTAVAGDCQEANVPGLPNPELASESDMLRAQQAVRYYIAVQQVFLDCVQNSRRYNQAVDRMHRVAEQYNRSAKRYKAKLESMNMITELAWLDLSASSSY